MNSRNHLVFLMILLHALIIMASSSSETTTSSSTTFHFPTLTLQNLTLLGDSHLRNGVVGLTHDSGVPSSSAGTVIYNSPVTFLDPTTNSTASFSTRFSFSIHSPNPLSSSGDGLSFFLSPESQTLGSPGGYLALVNSSKLTKNKFIAVEFDTRLDLHFNDPNDNHVGLDINSLESIKTADCSSIGIDLKSGDYITAWIDYWHDGKNLKVFLSESSKKPIYPILDIDIDLSQFLQEIMYLGFSGSTEGSTETHFVANWSFTSFGIRRVKPRITNPHNVTDNTVNKNPAIEVETVVGNNNNRHKRIGLIVGILGPVFFCSVLIVFGYVTFKKWWETKTDMNIQAGLLTGPKQFSYKELKAATNGFHSGRIIGHGAFGSVYQAVLTTGTVAAVKRSKHSHEGKTEFLAELSIIACLRHKNLVPLQGWCVEKGELLLVYEYMPYGSIDKVLYQESGDFGSGFLKWSHRYNISIGLASVLAYLHQECEQQVIHRDIKASNVMLDANFNARLGDFGLARIMDHDKSPVSTLTAGTMGYLAPEYLQYGKATDKTDVFSYGVVVLELCCGRRPIEREPEGHRMINLVDWVWGLHSKGVICDAVDKRLDNEFDLDEVRKLLLVGLSCANPDSEKRPSMRRVLQILNNESDEIIVPKMKPTLSFSNSLPLSIEDIIVSSLDGDEEDVRASASPEVVPMIRVD